MSSATSAATSTGSSRAELQAADAPARLTRVLSWAAAAGIGSAILIMIVASAVRYSPAVPPPPWSSGLPLLEIAGRLPVAATYAALWAAVALGGGGVIAGLAAVARGARFPAGLLDYVVIVQLAAGSFAMMPGGNPFEPPLGWLRTFSHAILFAWAPLVLLAAVAAVVLLCVSRAWNVGPRLAGRSPGVLAPG